MFFMSEQDLNIFQQLEELRQKEIPTALVTVIKISGSVPRDVGAKMIVQVNGQIHGTIGGSTVEALVIKEAQEAINSGRAQIVTHDLLDEDKQDTGMICGGTMEFFIDPIHLPERVYIFGGGHIGFHVASLAKKVGFDYVVIDDRAEYASAERFPDALNLVVDDPGTVAKKLKVTNNTFIIIVTRGHKDDYNVLRSVIEKAARYIGMIGSKTKRSQIFDKLRTMDGISDYLLKKIHSPIGIDIGAETPEEIALSIVAELIKVRRNIAP
jgi:xanthine dehydrogenase accessory factor